MNFALKSVPKVRRDERSDSIKKGNMFEQAEATKGVVITFSSVEIKRSFSVFMESLMCAFI